MRLVVSPIKFVQFRQQLADGVSELLERGRRVGIPSLARALFELRRVNANDRGLEVRRRSFQHVGR